MSPKEIKALVKLLEDDDTEVVHHVENEIRAFGTAIIPILEEEWESVFNPTTQRRIEDLIHQLQFELVGERLLDWKKNHSDDLLRGVWILATYQYPDLELSHVHQQLQQIFHEVWRHFRDDLQPYDKVRIINQVLFDQMKFRANTKNFHSPGNSMINTVLESKRGNPISLSTIYMLIARKLDMPVHGVNLPNLFILTYKDEGEDLQFYINVFNKGLIFSRDDIDNYIDHLKLPPQEIYYMPCSNEDIILRYLRNLVISFEKVDDFEKSDEIKGILKLLGSGNYLG
ncbi:MAG: transglutaminase-like domain-containing protein [Cyclobacteriaceae bacterium]|jgi:regulator of sirC expression with transglutaminase-like and TPR domain